MDFVVEFEQEEDGRWIGEVVDLPGALAYGGTLEHAMANVQAMAFRVLADRLEHGEVAPNVGSVSFVQSVDNLRGRTT